MAPAGRTASASGTQYPSQIPYPSQYLCSAPLCTLPLQEAKPGSGRARTDSAAMSLCATALRTVSTATPSLPLPRCVVRCAAEGWRLKA